MIFNWCSEKKIKHPYRWKERKKKNDDTLSQISKNDDEEASDKETNVEGKEGKTTEE